MRQRFLSTFTSRFNSAKKDNDFIYHETVPSLETLASVKGNGKLQCVHFTAVARFYHCVHAKSRLPVEVFY